MEDKICSVDGCELKVKAKGLCSTHHQRWYRHGHPSGKIKTRDTIQKCSLGSCDDPFFAKGLCKRHYAKMLRYGDPLGGRIVIRHCTVPGCDGAHRAKGLCGQHYTLMRKAGGQGTNPIPGQTTDNIITEIEARINNLALAIQLKPERKEFTIRKSVYENMRNFLLLGGTKL